MFPTLFMAESMFADLYGPMIFDRINLETSLHEISADVGSPREHLLKTLRALPVVRQTTGIMIKLKIIREQRHQTVDIMRVEGVEDGTVHPSNRFE